MATGIPVATSFNGWFRSWGRILLYATALLPLALFPEFFFPYVATRALLFRGLIELGIGSLFVALLRDRSILRFTFDPVALALLAFVAASALSAVRSPAPIRSFYGDFERMGGVWAWLHWLLYYVLLRTLFDDRSWTVFFRIAAGVSGLVGLIGLRDAYASIAGQTDRGLPALTSTIGNSGLFAGYMLFGLVFALLLAIRRDRYRFAYLLLAGFDLVAIGLSQNRSVIAGLVPGMLAGALAYFALHRGRARRWIIIVACFLAGSVAAAAYVQRVAPEGSIARSLPRSLQRIGSSGGKTGDEARTVQWRVAMQGFEEHPLLGIGPENHSLEWSKHFDSRLLHFDPVAVFDRPHNAFLEVPETTGILGAVAFAALWLAIFIGIRSAMRAGRLSAGETAILVGAQIAYAGYLFFWFTDVNSTPLWIALAAFVGARGLDAPLLAPDPGRRVGWPLRAAYGVGLLAVAATLVLHVVDPLRVARALNLLGQQRLPLPAGLGAIDDAFNSAGPQKSYAVLVSGEYLSSLEPRFGALRANRKDSAVLDSALSVSTAGSNREVRRDPLNDRLRMEYARLLLLDAEFYRDFRFTRAAVRQMGLAIDASPNRMNSRIILANVFAGLGDFSSALAQGRIALQIDPTLGQTHYEVARLLVVAGQPDSAAAELKRSQDLHFAGDPAAYLSIGGRLERDGRFSETAIIYQKYLTERYGERVWTAVAGRVLVTNAADIWLAAHLPLVELRAGDIRAAKRAANALLALDPKRLVVVASFDAALNSGGASAWLGKQSLIGCPPPELPEAARNALPPCTDSVPGGQGSASRN